MLMCLRICYGPFFKCRSLGRHLEKAMAPHSSTLAWKILWTEEPGGLQSMGSWRAGHDWATSLSRFTFMHWRRKWQPTPVFLPGESQGRESLVGSHLWGHKNWTRLKWLSCSSSSRQALLSMYEMRPNFLTGSPNESEDMLRNMGSVKK